MKYFLGLLILVSTGSCSVTADFDKKEFDIEAIKAQINKANEKYADRFTSNDSLWYIERYCKDACDFPPNEKPICGVDSLRKYFYGDGKNEPITMILKSTNIYGSKEAVVEEGIYDFPDGKGASFDKGKFIAIWKEEGGKWKLYKEIWNSDLPLKK